MSFKQVVGSLCSHDPTIHRYIVLLYIITKNKYYQICHLITNAYTFSSLFTQFILQTAQHIYTYYQFFGNTKKIVWITRQKLKNIAFKAWFIYFLFCHFCVKWISYIHNFYILRKKCFDSIKKSHQGFLKALKSILT